MANENPCRSWQFTQERWDRRYHFDPYSVYNNSIMPTRSSKDHDFTTIPKRVVEQASGEQWEGSPLPEKDAGKNPAAEALGNLGGAKGGAPRAAALSPRKRSA